MRPSHVETNLQIKQLLTAYPRGLNVSEISKKIRKTRNVVAKYLGILCASGQVELMEVGTSKLYMLAKRVPISGLLEFSSDYIIVLDEQSRILQVNTRLLTLLGETGKTIIGQTMLNNDNPFLSRIPVQGLLYGGSKTGGKPIEVQEIINSRAYYFSIKQVPIVFEDGRLGQTLILEDITERREAEEQTRSYLEQQEFFARKLTEFAELPQGADIFHAIGAGLDEIIPGAIIDVNEFDPGTNTLQFRAIFGKRAEEWYTVSQENGCCWEASPAYDSVQEVLSEGKLYKLPGGMYYASFQQITEEQGTWIENEFNLGDFYSIGLTWRGKLLGNILFVLLKGVTISNPTTVEIYGRAASIALQRHIAEEKHKSGIPLKKL
jgi:PAS domain S-box-containing protein